LSRRGLSLCAAAAVLFGLSTPAVSRLAGGMNPFVLAGLLYLGAALAVAPFASVSRPSDEAIRRAAPRLTVAVVLGGAVGPVLLAVGLRQIPAVTVALLLNLELVFTAILAAAVFREHLGRRVVAGTGLVVMAGLLLAWSGDARFRWGALIVAGACLCWAIDNGVTAKLDELAPVHITLAKGLVAGSANLMLGLAFGSAPSIGRVAAALLIGGFGYGASITLWIAGARELGAARGQLVFAAAPFVGALASWLALGDAVHLREVVSLVIALVGVSFVLRSDHEHRHGHARVEHEHEHGHDDGHHTGRDHDGSGGPTAGRHVHQHRHDPVVHAHPHLPDLHHRHDHDAH
jgi:drug/metabolite transporter (DMT)-like permease